MIDCTHPPSRRRTIIRSRIGTVEECERCGRAAAYDEHDQPIGVDPFAGQERGL